MSTKSDSRTATSEMAKVKSAKFALLARVGVLKREASALHGEADNFSSNVTELVALSTDMLTLLEAVEERDKTLSQDVLTLSSRHTQLMQHILYSLPPSMASRERVWKMLSSDGLATAMDITEEGYVSPSSAQILRNVVRAIGITKTTAAPNPSTNCAVLTT